MGALHSGKLRPAMLLFLLLAAFETGVSVAWCRIDHRPPRWDESHYLYISEYSYQQLKSFHIIRALDLHGVTGTKTGLVPFFTALSYFIVGHSPAVAAFLVNSVSFLLLAFALISLSSMLLNTPVPGFIGTLMFQSVPIVMIWSGYYQVDLPLTAVVAFTVMLCVCIDRSDFAATPQAYLLAVSVAVGMGVKHLYVGFVALPLAYLLLRALLSGRAGWEANLKSRWPVFAAVCAGVFAGAAYHLLNLHVLMEQIYRSRNIAATGATSAAPRLWSIFTTQIWNTMPGGTALNAPLLLAGAILTCAIAGRRVTYLVLWLVGGWAAVDLGASFPLSYYLLPLMPAVTLISAAVLCFDQVVPWQRRSLRFVSWAVAICFSVFLMRIYLQQRLGTADPIRLGHGAGVLFEPYSRVKASPFAGRDYWDSGVVDGNTATLPYPQDWKIGEIIQTLSGIVQRKPPSITTNARLLLDLEWMSGELFRYELLQAGLSNRLHLTEPDFAAPAEPAAWLQNADLLIIKSGRIFKADFYAMEWANRSQKTTEALLAGGGLLLKQHGFVLVRSFSLPDHSDVGIWVKQ